MKIPVTFAALCLLIMFLGMDYDVAKPLLRIVALFGIILTVGQLVDFHLVKKSTPE